MLLYTLKITFLYVLVVAASIAKGSCSIKNNDTLNYTHCLLSAYNHSNSMTFNFVISSSKIDFDRNTVFTRTSKSATVYVDSGLNFGHTYYWQYRCFDKKGKLIFTSAQNTFYISDDDIPVAKKFQNVILKNTDKHNGGYVVLDNGTIIDRSGNVIWFMPGKSKYQSIRNLNLNNDGNLTFLGDQLCHEIDLNGRILWSGPDTIDGIKIANYHHDFRKLSNGNFLCVAEKTGSNADKKYSVVFEISRENNIKWIWDEENYYNGDPSFTNSHLNSAMLDESNNKLYISCRDLGAAMKVDVRSGNVDYVIGKQTLGNTKFYRNVFFSGQHAVTILADKSVAIFNNNTEQNRNSGASSILILQQPTINVEPQIRWEYVFEFGNDRENFAGKLGGIKELDNKDLLIFAGNSGRTFEINYDKQIVWECISKEYNTEQNSLEPIVGYRASWIPCLFPSVCQQTRR